MYSLVVVNLRKWLPWFLLPSSLVDGLIFSLLDISSVFPFSFPITASTSCNAFYTCSQLSLPDTCLSVHSWWCSVAYCSQSKHGDSALLTNQNPTDEGTALLIERKLSRDSHVTLWIKDWDPESCSSFSSSCTSGKFHLSYFNGFLSSTSALSQLESPFLCLSWIMPQALEFCSL